MYGRCQADDSYTNPATHRVQFGGQPNDPMHVCSECAVKYKKPGNTVERL